MKLSLWLALGAVSLTGCTSLTTLFVAQAACDQKGAYCGQDREARRDTAVELAEEAYEYDKRIYKKVTGDPVEPPKEKYKVKDVYYCEDDEEKVCISTGECRCTELTAY